MKKILALLVVAAVAVGAYFYLTARPKALVLTGIVTTNEVVVSPQIAGPDRAALGRTKATWSSRISCSAVIAPGRAACGAALTTRTAPKARDRRWRKAPRRCGSRSGRPRIRSAQAEANVAATEAQQAAAAADLENARLDVRRARSEMCPERRRHQQELDQARTTFEVGEGEDRGAARNRSTRSAPPWRWRASNAEQVAMRRSQLHAKQHSSRPRPRPSGRRPTSGSPTPRSTRRSTASSTSAPRAPARSSTPGQPVVTLINPDDLWVRADVEETYIDRVRIGDELTVRLPSGDEREGTVFFRGVDAGFATQRDVSRTKRDIKTFEIRLRVDNRDRRLASGMTAYVLLPVQ